MSVPRIPKDDPTATYRGYRKQATYVLHRIFSEDNKPHRIFRPEGIEDLSVYSLQSTVCEEVVQVKDLAVDLAISHLYKSFARFWDEFLHNSSVVFTIATFGPIGPELQKAVAADGPERIRACAKLATQLNDRFGLEATSGELIKIFEATTIEIVDDRILKSEVLQKLTRSACGADPERSFENLWALVFLASEQSESLTFSTLQTWVTSVGRFVSSRSAFHDYWHSVVVPLDHNRSDNVDVDDLKRMFSEGQAATFQHIVAGLDIPRPTHYHRAIAGLKSDSIVIIRGASGQGKSTLAYRLAHDLAPSDWTFEIDSRRVTNPGMAARIAFALIEFKNAISPELIVIIGVAPSDSNWTVLVEELARSHIGKLIVTVREDDWQRSRPQVNFAELELTLDETESRQIFDLLSESNSVDFPTFEVAWQHFGGSGPLLEFVYLLKESRTLESKIREQVANLRNPDTKNHLDHSELQFLRCVLVASMAGANCDARALAEYCKLADPAKTLSNLEREFLVVKRADGTISGLHPLRSEVACRFLLDRIFATLQATISDCFSCLDEADLNAFGLFYFDRNPELAESLFESLCSLKLQSWTAYAGAARAVMWFGIDCWIKDNDDAIRSSYADYVGGWFFCFEWNVARVGEISTETLFRNLPSLGHSGVIPSSGTSTMHVFDAYRKWSNTQLQIPSEPKSENDWIGMTETLFWMAHLGITIDLSVVLSEDLFVRGMKELSLPVFADLCRAADIAIKGDLRSWCAKYKMELVEKFRNEARIVSFIDDGSVITAHGLISTEIDDNCLGGKENLSHGSFLNDLAWQRVCVMSGLFPERTQYCFDGYGHMIKWLGVDHNAAAKSPMRENITAPWGPELNHSFIERGTWKFRPQTWRDHFELLRKLRSAVVKDLACLRHLIIIQPEYSPKTLARFADSIAKITVQLFHSGCPMPQVAVDRWGRGGEMKFSLRGGWLERYNKALNDYLSPIGNFVKQVQEVVKFSASMAETASPIRLSELHMQFDDLSRVSFVNLAFATAALQQLYLMLEETSSIRSMFCADFQDEIKVYQETIRLWDSARKFLKSRQWERLNVELGKSNHKRRQTNRLKQVSYVERLKLRWLEQLRDELTLASNDEVKFGVLSDAGTFEKLPSLWIGIDTVTVEAAFSQELVRDAAITTRRGIGTELGCLENLLQEQIWHKILFVPLYKGKSLFGRVYTSLDIVRHNSWEVDWDRELWRFVPKEMAAIITQELQLSIWTSPWLERQTRVANAIGAVVSQLNHYQDFLRVPTELDDIGTEIIRSYVGRSEAKLGQSLGECVISFSELFELLPSADSLDHTTSPALLRAYQQICDAWRLLAPEKFVPGQGMSIPLDELEQYTSQLVDCLNHLSRATISLLSDISPRQ